MAKVGIVARSRREEYVSGYVSPGVYIDESGESFVQQADFEKADINHILDRFVRTGILESVSRTQGSYGDFSDITDFHSALLQVEHAKESFMTLPATLRERFENDPGRFLDFVSNPANEAEMASLGLLNDEAMARYDARLQREAAEQAASSATPKG